MVCLLVLARTGKADCWRSYASFLSFSGSTAVSISLVAHWHTARGIIKWRCTQERWDPEDAIIFGMAARYAGLQLAVVQKIRIRIVKPFIRGRFAPIPAFLESHFHIAPHGPLPQVLELLPVFSCISWACAFNAGGDASLFFSEQAEEGICTHWLPQRAGSSGI
jgi:hypothetical protein